MKRHFRPVVFLSMCFIVFMTSSCSNNDTNSQPATVNPSTASSFDSTKQTTTIESSTPSNSDSTKQTTTIESSTDKEPNSSDTLSSLNKARELNDKGYNEYKKGNFKAALDLFKQSMEYDYKFYLSHYNYACTLGVLMKKDYPEWYEHKKELIYHLTKVKELKPDYISKIKTDPDLDPVRKEFGYMLMLGYSPSKSKDVEQILQQLNWYIEGQGAFPYVGGIKFNKDSTITMWYYSPAFFNDYNTDDKYQVTGKYTVDGNKITITLDKKMLRKKNWNDIVDNDSIIEDKTTINARLTQDGILENDMFDYKIKCFYDEFSA